MNDFEKRVKRYMQCEKRTLAEMLALIELDSNNENNSKSPLLDRAINGFPSNKSDETEKKETKNDKVGNPIDINPFPVEPNPWIFPPYRVGDYPIYPWGGHPVWYTTSTSAKSAEADYPQYKS